MSHAGRHITLSCERPRVRNSRNGNDERSLLRSRSWGGRDERWWEDAHHSPRSAADAVSPVANVIAIAIRDGRYLTAEAASNRTCPGETAECPSPTSEGNRLAAVRSQTPELRGFWGHPDTANTFRAQVLRASSPLSPARLRTTARSTSDEETPSWRQSATTKPIACQHDARERVGESA